MFCLNEIWVLNQLLDWSRFESDSNLKCGFNEALFKQKPRLYLQPDNKGGKIYECELVYWGNG